MVGFNEFLNDMNVVLFYLLIKLLLYVFLFVMYCFLDIFFWLLFWVFGFCKKVILGNLECFFFEKLVKEIDCIVWEYYWYLCDLVVEVVCFFSILKEEIKCRGKMVNLEILEFFYEW